MQRTIRVTGKSALSVKRISFALILILRVFLKTMAKL